MFFTNSPGCKVILVPGSKTPCLDACFTNNVSPKLKQEGLLIFGIYYGPIYHVLRATPILSPLFALAIWIDFAVAYPFEPPTINFVFPRSVPCQGSPVPPGRGPTIWIVLVSQSQFSTLDFYFSFFCPH